MERVHKTQFAIDSLPDMVFEGYTNNDTWNGWACPFLKKEEAEKILSASEQNNFTWKYDADADAFVVENKDDKDEHEAEIFESLTITDDQGNVEKVYGRTHGSGRLHSLGSLFESTRL